MKLIKKEQPGCNILKFINNRIHRDINIIEGENRYLQVKA